MNRRQDDLDIRLVAQRRQGCFHVRKHHSVPGSLYGSDRCPSAVDSPPYLRIPVSQGRAVYLPVVLDVACRIPAALRCKSDSVLLHQTQIALRPKYLVAISQHAHGLDDSSLGALLNGAAADGRSHPDFVVQLLH